MAGSRDAPQSGLCEAAPAIFHRPPTLESAEKTGRNLRVLSVEEQDDLGDELIAAAIRRVELCLVSGSESADQSTNAIGIGEREGWMIHQFLQPCQGAGFGD